MPLPTAAELTDPTATNADMKQRLAQLVDNLDELTPELTQSITTNLTLLQGVFVSVADKVIVSSEATGVFHIPVLANTEYTIKASSFNPSAFAGIYVNNMTARTKLENLTFETIDSTTIKFITPSSLPVDAVLVFNALIPSQSFDIRSSAVISSSKNEIKKIDGLELMDTKARQDIKSLDAQFKLKELVIGYKSSGYYSERDYYNQATNITGKFVSPSGGVLVTSASATMAYFSVNPGSTYYIKSSNFDADKFVACLRTTSDVSTNTSLGVLTLNSTAEADVKSFTVPVGSAAKFCFFNVVLSGLGWDIRSSLHIYSNQNLQSVLYKKGESGIYDQFAHDEIKTVNERIDGISIEAGESILKGKNWVVIGDSITEANGRTLKNYHKYISETVGGMYVHNYGIGGSGYYNRSGVADTILHANVDYVTVFFGTNDWANINSNNKPLGTFLDTGTTTISGCINTCLMGLLNKYPTKKIAVLTPLPRVENWGSNAANNAQGYTLEQLADLVVKYAKHYSLPVLDLYHESNLPVWIAAGNTYYFTPPAGGAADGLHPNDAGHQIIARKVQKFLESI